MRAVRRVNINMDEFVTDNIGVIISGSVRFLSKKNNQTKKKKKRPETEPDPAQTGRFRSGFLAKKPDKPICIF